MSMIEVRKASNPRRELVREELLTRAAEVFEAKGFAQTRLEDIALALNLKRSALYYYFQTKNDILRALVEQYAENVASKMEEIAANHPGTYADKLRALLSSSILDRMEGGARFRALDGVGAEMPEDIKKSFAHARRRILDIYVATIRDGMDAGEFRSLDPGVAALAVLGVANWTSWWYRPNGRQEPQELARTLIDIAIQGLVPSEADRAQRRSATEIIGFIENDLAELRRLTDRQN